VSDIVDIDELRELLTIMRDRRDTAGRECARVVRANGYDDISCKLADRWAVLDAEVVKLERMIARQVAG